MQKETLTLENIKKDLYMVAYRNISNEEDRRLHYIIPTTLLAIAIGIIVGIALQKPWLGVGIGLFLFSFPAYHIVCYAINSKDYKAKLQAIEDVLARGNISVSVEVLSHISVETGHEPYDHDPNGMKETAYFHFQSGLSWKVPNVWKHYKWSPNYYLSTKGLKNIAVEGNKFFYIALQGHHDAAYVYPCKLFVLDSKLNQKNE